MYLTPGMQRQNYTHLRTQRFSAKSTTTRAPVDWIQMEISFHHETRPQAQESFRSKWGAPRDKKNTTPTFLTFHQIDAQINI